LRPTRPSRWSESSPDGPRSEGVLTLTGSRMRRVDEAIREVLSEAIPKEIQDERVGFVTVTDVETSPDLRHARVFLSVLGNQEEREESLSVLQGAHGRLQRSIATQLRLKHTPELEIRYDDSIDRGIRVDEILEHEINREEEE